MGLFVWDVQPSKIFVGDTQISKVFLWDTQVRPTQLVRQFTTTTTSGISDAKAIYTSWYTVSKIEMDTTIRFSWNAQIYFRLSPVNSYSSQDLIACTFDYWYSSTPWKWYIQWGRDGVSWTTYQSGWNISTGVDYILHIEFTRTGWTISFGGTTTSLNYTTAEANIITSIFDSTTSIVGASTAYWSWAVSNTLTYTVTYI